MKNSRLTIHLIHIHVKNETLLDDSPFLRIQLLACLVNDIFFTFMLCMTIFVLVLRDNDYDNTCPRFLALVLTPRF